MNDFDADFDAQLSDAIGARAGAAPSHRPEFTAVLADRQQRTRRRTVVATTALLVVGVTGIAAFGSGRDPAPSTADGPDASSGELFVTTTLHLGTMPRTTPPGIPMDGTVGEATLWYCEGAIEYFSAFPTTTTIAPATTTPDEALAPEEFVAPPEDSGYFRDCHLVLAEGVPTATYVDQFPTTTTQDGSFDAATATTTTTTTTTD